MHRYFLHLKHLDELVPDCEGAQLESIEAAKDEARCAVRDMASQALQADTDFTLQSIRICNGNGEMLAEVSSQDVLAKVFSPGFAPA
jgi:hypothetical protein